MKPAMLAGVALVAVLVPACGEGGRVKVAPLPSPKPATRESFAKLASENCKVAAAIAAATTKDPTVPENPFDYAAAMAQINGTAKGYVEYLRLQKPPPADTPALTDYLAKVEASHKAALDTVGHYQQKEIAQATADTAVWVVRLRAVNAAGATLGFQCGLPTTILPDTLALTDSEAQSRLNAVGSQESAFFRTHRRYTGLLAAELSGAGTPISVGLMLIPPDAVAPSTQSPATTPIRRQLSQVETRICLRAAAETGKIWYVFGNELGLMTAPSVNSCEV